jgi:hypothetical protein
MSDKHFLKYVEEQSKFLKELESKQTAFFEKLDERISKLEKLKSVHSTVSVKTEETPAKMKKAIDPLSTPKYKSKAQEKRKILEKLSNETLQKIVEDWPKFYDKYHLF